MQLRKHGHILQYELMHIYIYIYISSCIRSLTYKYFYCQPRNQSRPIILGEFHIFTNLSKFGENGDFFIFNAYLHS